MMPEIPDRIDGEIIAASHVNTNRDRTIQRYSSASNRDTLMPLPVTGDTAWLDNINQLTIYTGTTWMPVAGAVPYILDESGPVAGAVPYILDESGRIRLGLQGNAWSLIDTAGSTTIHYADADGFIRTFKVIAGEDGTQGLPAYTFATNRDLGIRRQADDVGALVSQGEDSMWWNQAGVYFRKLSETGDNPNAYLDGSGRIHKSVAVMATKADVDALDAKITSLQAQIDSL